MKSELLIISSNILARNGEEFSVKTWIKVTNLYKYTYDTITYKRNGKDTTWDTIETTSHTVRNDAVAYHNNQICKYE